MIFNKDMLLLYAVTDRSWTLRQTLYEQIEDALKGGITMLQLREKNLSDDDFVDEALQIKELCHRYNVPLIINDNVEIALKSGADGVHVGIEDESVISIRKRVDKNFIIGATAKTLEQAQVAEKSGADYLGVGAVFPSPTKKNAIRITPEELKILSSSVSTPTVAIGGINLNNISSLKNSGISGVAVVSTIFASYDIISTTKQLKNKIYEVIYND